MKCMKYVFIILVALTLSSCKEDPTITAVNFVGDDIVDYHIGVDDYQTYEIEILYDDDSNEVLLLTDLMIKDYTIELFNSVGLKDVVIEYEGFETSVRFKVYETALDLELLDVFELAVDAEVTTLTYSEWIESIKGEDGIGVESVTIDALGHLIITFTDDTTSDLGIVIGRDGANAGDGYYIVNFYSHSGFIISSQLVAEGSDAVGFTPDMPVGYIFDNWIGDYTTVTEHLDILPSYHKELYYINFVYDGVFSIEDIEYGEAVVLPVPTKHGFFFNGWYLGNTSNSERVYDTTPITNTMTLYPLWEEGIYTLNIGLIGDVNYGIQTRTFSGLLQTDIVPTRVGFTFAGWFVDDDLSMMFDPTVAEPGSYSLYPGWFEGTISFEIGMIGGVETEYVNIVSYIGSDNDVVLPAYMRGFEVLSIGDEAFKDNLMSSIQLPPNVAIIGEEAFSGCNNVQEIVFPASVEEIGSGALIDMNGLEFVVLHSVTDIPDWFLAGSVALTSITIPNGVESIGANAFNGTGITSITIPDSVTYIGEYAFYGAYSLSSVVIPGNVISIQNSTFEGTTLLSDVTLPNSVLTIGDRAFANSGVTTINWPSSLKLIDTEAFENSIFDSLVLNEGLETINDNAFRNSLNLVSVVIPSTVIHVSGNALEGTIALETLEVAVGTTAYSSSENCLYEDYGTTLLHAARNMQTDTLTLHPNTEVIGNRSLVIDAIITLNIPDSLEESFPNNLRYLPNLVNVNVYENDGSGYYSSVNGILYGNHGASFVKFGSNRVETSYVILSSVTVIEDYAFEGASSIITLTLPSGLRNIEEGAFKDMINVGNFTIPETVGFIEDYAFYNCDSITSLVLSTNIDVLSPYAYAEMDTLTTFVMNSNYIDSVGDYFIYNSPMILELAFDNVNFIGIKAFFGMSPNTDISIQNGDYYIDAFGAIYKYYYETSWGDYAYALTHYPSNIDETTYVIPNWLFTKYVLKIQALFGDNSTIDTLYIGSNIWMIHSEVFFDTPTLTSIYVSRGTTSIIGFNVIGQIYNDNYTPGTTWYVSSHIFSNVRYGGYIPDDIIVISD